MPLNLELSIPLSTLDYRVAHSSMLKASAPFSLKTMQRPLHTTPHDLPPLTPLAQSNNLG